MTTQTTSRLREQMDGQCVRAIYLSIIARYERIQLLYDADKPEIYPGELATRTEQRQRNLADLIHLAHEMGWDFEEIVKY